MDTFTANTVVILLCTSNKESLYWGHNERMLAALIKGLNEQCVILHVSAYIGLGWRCWMLGSEGAKVGLGSGQEGLVGYKQCA